MAKILLVENIDFFRKAVKRLLERAGHEVDESETGKQAQDLVSLNIYDVIISAMKMPHFDGLDLCEWLKSKIKPPLIILLTDFISNEDAERIQQLQVKYILKKPFLEADLLNVIVQALPNINKILPAEKEISQEKFCKVPLAEFVSDRKFDFEVYLRLSEQKYLKLLNSGYHLTEDRLKRLKDKGLEFLYVKEIDFHKILAFNIFITQAMNESTKINLDKKINFLRYTGELILESVFVGGFDPVVFHNAKQFIENSLSVISKNDKVFDLINLLNSHSDAIYAHSVGVSLYSVMIAQKLSWESPQNLFKLSLAGFLHDIGYKEISRELLGKPRSVLTLEELREIETHPMRGKEILESLTNIPTEIITVALEHHENLLGLGYPRKLKAQYIHPMSRVISVADEFCYLTIKFIRATVLSAPEAILRMEQFKKDELDPVAYRALKNLIISAN